MVLIYLIVAFAMALAMTGMVRRYALNRQMIDVPNARSSHVIPTPRGGGLSVVIVFLLGLGGLALAGAIPPSQFVALAGAGLLVAVIGFLDDHAHIPARRRLAGHFISTVWLLYWLGNAPLLTVLGVDVHLGLPESVAQTPWLLWPPGALLASVYLVWSLNLFNFMDGIDGIAGIQTVTVCLGGALLYWLHGQYEPALAPLLLAAATAGFLCWNLPPARIFMGDAGSGFLGIMLAGLTLQAGLVDQQLFWGWLLLMGVFVVDATWTLIRRILAGENPAQAHRSHAYQHASRVFGGHRPVTVAVGLINGVWLLPIAIAVTMEQLSHEVGLVLGWLPLGVLAWYFRAGNRARQDLTSN